MRKICDGIRPRIGDIDLSSEKLTRLINDYFNSGDSFDELAHEIAEKAEVHLAGPNPVFQYKIVTDKFDVGLDKVWVPDLRNKIIEYLEDFKVNARVQRIVEEDHTYINEYDLIVGDSYMLYTVTIIRK